LTSLKSPAIKNEVTQFRYTDPMGTYTLNRELGVVKNKNQVFTKMSMTDVNKPKDLLEKGVAISKVDLFKTKQGKIKILLPEISQYTVWFDGGKFFSQLKLDREQKKLEIILKGPEKKWQGTTEIPLEKNYEGAYCFFSQIPECVQVTNFLKMAVAKQTGKMSFKVIWDKYPYIQEQYKNLPIEPVSDGVFFYDGLAEDGSYKFILKVAGHHLFYHFSKDLTFSGHFWVIQGITQVKKESSKDSIDESL
jgi:hypothetical protein